MNQGRLGQPFPSLGNHIVGINGGIGQALLFHFAHRYLDRQLFVFRSVIVIVGVLDHPVGVRFRPQFGPATPIGALPDTFLRVGARPLPVGVRAKESHILALLTLDEGDADGGWIHGHVEGCK